MASREASHQMVPNRLSLTGNGSTIFRPTGKQGSETLPKLQNAETWDIQVKMQTRYLVKVLGGNNSGGENPRKIQVE